MSETVQRIKCDFCDENILEAWVYEHGPFKFVAGGTFIDIETGAVAACSKCRPLFEAHQLPDLLERVRKELGARSPTVLEQLRHYYAGLMRRAGPPKHYKLGDQRDPGPRFFAYTCPRCRTEIRYDAASYDGYTRGNCPGCGVEISQVGKPAAPKEAKS